MLVKITAKRQVTVSASEMGVITQGQTGGIDLKLGNAKALCQLAELTGKGEGFGAEIGLSIPNPLRLNRYALGLKSFVALKAVPHS